jgi:hypothetical protein
MSHLVLVHLLAYRCDVIQFLDLVFRWDGIENCRCTAFPGRILVYFLEVRFNARDTTSLHVSIE